MNFKKVKDEIQKRIKEDDGYSPESEPEADYYDGRVQALKDLLDWLERGLQIRERSDTV